MAASTFRGVEIPPAASDDRLALERVVSRVPGPLRLGLRLFPRLPMTSRLRRRALEVDGYDGWKELIEAIAESSRMCAGPPSTWSTSAIAWSCGPG
jgi:hypothetical protein